eukprot:6366086-Lingulodinium_polyedra.AAC.1
MARFVADGITIVQGNQSYAVGPLTALAQRAHRIPSGVTSAAQLLHRAARGAGDRLAGQRWDPGLHSL